MATNGEIEINSEEIYATSSIIKETSTTLEAMLPIVTGSFSVLEELGFFSEGLSKISKQIQSLMAANEMIDSRLISHIEDIQAMEQNLLNLASSSSGGGSYYGRYTGSSGGRAQGSNVSTDNVNKGTQVNDEQINKSITEMDSPKETEFLSFVEINKGDASLSELFLDPSKSGLLLKLLKKFYGDTSDNLSDAASDNSYTIQKDLLEKILNNDGAILSKLKEDSILVAKEYLNSVAKENNVKVSELILNDKNSEIYKKSLLALYDGNEISKYNLKESDVMSYRIYLDKKAEEGKTSVEYYIAGTKKNTQTA